MEDNNPPSPGEPAPDETPKILLCHCGRPTALRMEDGAGLCVECYLKFVQAMQIQQADGRMLMNYLVDSMEMATGVYGIGPRFPNPQPTIQPLIQNAPMTNVRIDRSTVGAVNTGQIDRLKRRVSGPVGKAKRLFEEISRLQRGQQEKIFAILEPYIAQHSSKRSRAA